MGQHRLGGPWPMSVLGFFIFLFIFFFLTTKSEPQCVDCAAMSLVFATENSIQPTIKL